MYLKYPARSLFRGGQRTLLAIFCVAVGVMAIVALQLVGLMINNAFNSNVRDANGGDIAVRSQNQPFTEDDLKKFEQLEKDGVITNFTPVITTQASTGQNASVRETFTVRVIDPENYPVVTAPSFNQPAGGTLEDLIKEKQVVVTQPFADQYKKKVGDTFDVRIGGARGEAARTIKVKLVGIVSETGALSQAGSVVLLSIDDYKAANTKVKPVYDTINVTAESAKIKDAAKRIQSDFPIANTQTAEDALRQQQAIIDNIRYFLEISGLLALLIGGVGIVNTMQVLLSRRKTEIAMLKTTGYRRFDLYILFGLEAGLLGLIGGVVGAGAATGVSYLVRNLVEQSFGLNIPFLLDWVTIGGGVLIGVVTALIFGLMPIVQAANIRPLNVIRDIAGDKGIANFFLVFGLLLVLSVLFCALAIVILNGNIILGVSSVYGTFIFLGLLSLFFSLIILIISKLPVLERFTIWYVLIVLALVALSAGMTWVYPAFGSVFLVFSIMGFVIVLLPRSWKANVKMALRNLGRQRARTTTTMVALFVGIFTIGLILVLGQNLRGQVNNAIATSLNYNVFSITSGDDTKKLSDTLESVPGLDAYQKRSVVTASPVKINEDPIQKRLPPSGQQSRGSQNSLGRQGALFFLSGIEGFDVANNQLPSKKSFDIVAGRNLNADDAGTDNVLVASQVSEFEPLRLKVGDKITLVGIDRTTTKTVTIVGVYRSKELVASLQPVLGTADTVKALTPGGASQTVFYMKINPDQLSKAVDVIGKTVPNAFLLNLANIGDIINDILNNILLTLTTIASLSLVAGVIIIANAVALAMLERRRELGILKSVGYTSRSILSEVMLENGIVGGTGAAIAMALVLGVIYLLGELVFKSSFSVDSSITLALVFGSAILAMLTAAFVAWGAVRVRPLEVLRYE